VSRKRKPSADPVSEPVAEAIPDEVIAEGSEGHIVDVGSDAIGLADSALLATADALAEAEAAIDDAVAPEADLSAGDAMEAAADDGSTLEASEASERSEESIDETSEDAGAGGATLPTSASSMDSDQLRRLVEALVFASDKPLTVARLRQLTRVSDTRRLEQALAEIAALYTDRGVMLQQVSGGYQFRTATQFSGWVQQLIAGRPVRLTRAQLETLAIIAYRQPITRPEIDEIRGVDSSATLKLLIDRALIRILGKKEEVGRPMLYGTTKEFLDFFSLGDLRELPTLREYSELSDESRREISDRLGPLADGDGGDDGNNGGGGGGSFGGGDGGGGGGGAPDTTGGISDTGQAAINADAIATPTMVPDGAEADAIAILDAIGVAFGDGDGGIPTMTDIPIEVPVSDPGTQREAVRPPVVPLFDHSDIDDELDPDSVVADTRAERPMAIRGTIPPDGGAPRADDRPGEWPDASGRYVARDPDRHYPDPEDSEPEHGDDAREPREPRERAPSMVAESEADDWIDPATIDAAPHVSTVVVPVGGDDHDTGEHDEQN
jgi:segregation and condensation protein B